MHPTNWALPPAGLVSREPHTWHTIDVVALEKMMLSWEQSRHETFRKLADIFLHLSYRRARTSLLSGKVHSAPYLVDDARAATWAALYQSAIDGINGNNDRAKFGGSGLRMQINTYN